MIDTSPNINLTLYVLDGAGEESRVLTQESGDFYIRGAEEMNIPFTAFPGIHIPHSSSSGQPHNR